MRNFVKGDSLNRPRIDELDCPVEVRRHPGARRLTLRVSRTRRAVIVTMPVQCDLGEAGTFLNRNIEWVRERLSSIPQPVPFAHGALVPLRGEYHSLVFTGQRAVGGVVQVVQGPTMPELHVAGQVEHAPRRLRDWLSGEARRDLDERVQVHTRALGLAAKRIAIRDQATRWGSCSTTGVLSFSWRLILAPTRVLDYVAAHEVAHLAEMNHGPKFWALVEQLIPAMKEDKRWLQVYGLDLHRYGSSETD
ncbi:Zinc metalloprotease [Hyphomicrobium sulfonivorans]|uniref:Zinc metalloprotease n=1 Tax=Hyphomicrobium sulfonivorans TaxID=121290 RepID=A0A109BLC5_HYPSL|nr:Zinc metalloprotease [Hyphomicrobium sulfonivorans]MBI1648291.1 M48 family metallopeptidase [Hyphomicrobium sulfonivorans]NSL71174.1 M48 family peptidase [Hyphomicrobium sulfonivorans]